MTNIDISLFRLINKACANPAFDRLMPLVTKLGGGETIFVIALICFFAKKRAAAGILLLAGLTLEYNVVHFLKEYFARPRPFVVIPDVRTLIGEKSFSFPSGHAAGAFMAATVLSRFFKRRAAFFSLALLVAFSRVYLGVHYVSDVLSGAILGIAIGWALVFVSKYADLTP